MPEEMERELRKTAKKKWPGDKENQDKYVYGAMRRSVGWKPNREKKGKK